MKNRIILCSVSIAALLLGPLAQARYLNPETGRFQTMDSYEGNYLEPLALHKYLYCHANPVNSLDPSGHESLSGILLTMPIMGALAGQFGPNITARGAVASGNTCGPNVTEAVLATTRDVENTWRAAGRAKANNAMWSATYSARDDASNRNWDIHKLNDVGVGDTTINFGNGSHLGTGPIGKQTVQFSWGGKPGVYYAGSVNYILWGRVFSLADKFFKFPVTGASFPEYSEWTAVTLAQAHKWRIGDLGTDYEKQAVAFVKLGYSAKDPSATALKSIKPNPSNVASPDRFLWKWKHLHDNFE